MIRRLLLGLAAGSLTAAACVDLFHDTGNLPTLCSDGGSAPACRDASAEAEAGPPSPFTTDSARALERAQQTCAWLSACASPLGENLTGKCLVNAILAFDESANPNRKPKGEARAFWQCAYNAALAKRCDAMNACTFNNVVQVCAGTGFVGCAGKSANTRVVCAQVTSPPPSQACVATGQRCGAQDPGPNQHDAICAGPQGQYCMTSGCSGGKLSACSDAGVDLGQDCAMVGAGLCSSDAGACVPEGSGACTPTSAIDCDDAGAAVGCQTGVPERVDCTKISGLNGCVPRTALGHEPPSSACNVAGGGCGTDQCDGTSLQACVRGRFIAVDCAAQGLKPCAAVTTPEGTFDTCSPP